MCWSGINYQFSVQNNLYPIAKKDFVYPLHSSDTGTCLDVFNYVFCGGFIQQTQLQFPGKTKTTEVFVCN